MSESEEKTLDASDKKLREARKKGQVAHFPDLMAAMGLLVGLGSLWAFLPGFLTFFDDIMTQAFNTIPEAGDIAYLSVIGAARQHAMAVLAPLMGLLIGVAVLTTVVVHKGLPFSLDPMTPKLSNMDPVQGVKRIFGMRGLVELGKNLTRFVAALAVIWLVMRYSVNALIQAPGCGLECLLGALLSIAVRLFLALLFLALIFAVPDILLQQWIFRRDQKMGQSEMRREQKDTHGSAEIRGARQQIRHDMEQMRTKMGIRHASIVIYGKTSAVGLRYVKSEVPVPMVVALSKRPEQTEDLMLKAQFYVVPHYRDDVLADCVAALAKPGAPAPQEEFQRIAEAMARLNVGT